MTAGGGRDVIKRFAHSEWVKVELVLEPGGCKEGRGTGPSLWTIPE